MQGYCSDALTEVITGLTSTPPGPDRDALIADADRILREDDPLIPIVFGLSRWALLPDVSGYTGYPNGELPAREMSITR
jgi:ABC-type transport system substrate-binding protein